MAFRCGTEVARANDLFVLVTTVRVSVRCDAAERGLDVLRIAFNGVNSERPVPVDAIVAAHTIAPFGHAGGHINPHNGYDYHAVTGHTKQIAQPNGHAPMIGYSMDGSGLYAHTGQDGNVPTDLDECGDHSDVIRGHYPHAGAPRRSRIIRGFRGSASSMVAIQLATPPQPNGR